LKSCYLLPDDKKYKLTHRTIDAIAQSFGVVFSSVEDADILLITVDDPDDLGFVRLARKKAGTRPLIAGGFECFGGEYLLRYCDALNVGEGFDFFEALSSAKSANDLYSLPFVMTREKTCVVPSYRIDEKTLPLVRITSGAYYYQAGRGCKGKCLFCETSFAYQGWSNSPARINGAIAYAEKKRAKLTLVTNDSAQIDHVSKSINAQSVRVVDYLKNPELHKSSGILHFGIEGFCEDHRKTFGKYISDANVFELIACLEQQNQPSEFFFITGLPGTFDAMMSFAARVPNSVKTHPKIAVKLTRLDPSPHTPMWTYDLKKIDHVTHEQFKMFVAEIKSRNIRFSVFRQRSGARMIWRACLRRCTPDEVDSLGKEPEPSVDESIYTEQLEARGLSHLLTYCGYPMPGSQVVLSSRDLRDRMADKLGLISINYKYSTPVQVTA